MSLLNQYLNNKLAMQKAASAQEDVIPYLIKSSGMQRFTRNMEEGVLPSLSKSLKEPSIGDSFLDNPVTKISLAEYGLVGDKSQLDSKYNVFADDLYSPDAPNYPDFYYPDYWELDPKNFYKNISKTPINNSQYSPVSASPYYLSSNTGNNALQPAQITNPQTQGTAERYYNQF